MTKEEFLSDQTRGVTEIFEKYGSYTPTFAVLYDDGTTDSFANNLDSDDSKSAFSFFMRSICKNPRVYACIFTTTGWSSSQAEKQNKRPSECDDREQTILLIYNTRDKVHELYMYTLLKNGKLRLDTTSTSFGGRFSDPFFNGNMTKDEKLNAIEDFQESARKVFCNAFKEFGMMFPIVLFFEDTPEKVCIHRVTGEEWDDKPMLKKTIISRCQEVETLAFTFAFPEEDEKVDIILVSEDIQKIYHYSINQSDRTLRFENSETYTGEYSDSFRLDLRIMTPVNPFKGYPRNK